MSEPTPDEQRQHLLRWCEGNTEAVQLLELFGELSQIADDIADGDVEPTEIERVLHIALVEIPSNPFYQAFQWWYIPAIAAIINWWGRSNEWAMSPLKETRIHAYAYRDAAEGLIGITAQLCGGDAARALREAHAFYHQRHAECYEAWEEEHGVVERGRSEPSKHTDG